MTLAAQALLSGRLICGFASRAGVGKKGVMDNVTARVARQYTDHAYPHPYDDIAAEAAGGRIDMGDPSIYGPLFWPEGRDHEAIDILVAGCGTVQAAMIAYKNPGARIVGVDLSDASLGHERFLKEKHGLANLELYQGDLREIGRLGRRFDLVVSSGVLHHMPDPGEGLRALGDVLAPGGAMLLMVYGAVGRLGVYPLQDAFRRMRLGQGPEDIAAVRAVLAALPATHPVQPFVERAPGLSVDSEVVDVFLHPQDRAYTVPEALAWLEDNGLAFQGWAENHLYYPDAMIPSAIAALIERADDRDRWAIVETLHGLARTHTFVARRPGEARPVDFGDPSWTAYRPTPKPGAALSPDRADGSSKLTIFGLDFELNPLQTAGLRRIDGQRTIAQVMDQPAFGAFSEADRLTFGRAMFHWLWRIGAVMLSRQPPLVK